MWYSHELSQASGIQISLGLLPFRTNYWNNKSGLDTTQADYLGIYLR